MIKSINQPKLILNEGYQNNLYFHSASSEILNSTEGKLIDLSSSGGTLILGHEKKIKKKIFNYFLKNNLSFFSAPNKFAVDFAELLGKIFKKYKFIFCNSGAEANIKALRICRNIKPGSLILRVTGSWHGSVDNFLITKNLNENRFISKGIDYDLKNKIKFLPFNNINESEKIIKKFNKQTFCIITEPIQAGFPINSKEYNKFLEQISKKYKIPLIFDEIITGLRSDGSSYSNLNNISPDIITLGKAFGGGFPVGIIAVKKKISYKCKDVFFGGTYSANPLSMLACYEYTKNILVNKKKIFLKLNKMSENFVLKIERHIKNNNIDAQIHNYKSLIRILFSAKSISNRTERDFVEVNKLDKIKKFQSFLKKKGIYYPSNGIIFMPYMITKKNLNFCIQNINYGLSKFFK